MSYNNRERMRVADSVIAAIETGAKFRRPHESEAETDPVGRIVAMVESEAARLRGNDFSALNAVLGNQALALDTIFTLLAKEAVEDDIVRHQSLRLALRAQSQSRSTLDSLVAIARPRATRPHRAEKNSDEQNAANTDRPSR
jgi:hypothetical protein